ncbi:MAG: hypothetical protein A2Y24_06440 [Clostridiales bacterium GWE2_32_10]|nr:MAG: hypothetical protein A2Y24_06440 [Clostridiales bacterium GWE2_32_10]HBY20851.1 hypothetical protein [Clostridiales bacterium]
MITLEKAIDMFLTEQYLKGNTVKTKEFYKTTLGYFVNFIGKDKLISDITMQDLNSYKLGYGSKLKMENHPFPPAENKLISKTTIQTYIRSVRAFLGYLFTEGYLKDDFRRSFKLPKAPIVYDILKLTH